MITPSTKPLSGGTVGAGVHYVGESKGLYASGTNANQNIDVAAYTTIDAALRYDLGRFGLPGFTVGVKINNLFDREYVGQLLLRLRLLLGS